MAENTKKKNSTKTKKTTAAKKPAATKKKVLAKTKKTTQKKVEKVAKPTKKVTKSASKPAKKAVKSVAPKKTVKPASTKKTPNKTTENVMTNSKNQFANFGNFDKIANDAADSSKKQLEALSKSGSIFWKGCEDLVRECMSLAQDSTEKNSKIIQTLMSTKNINEWAETSNKLTQQSFDDTMAGLTKISELSVKVATDSLEPINDQITKAVKKASSAIAA